MQNRVDKLTGVASDVFECLDYHDDQNEYVDKNFELAFKVQAMQDRIKHLEDLVSRYESDD